MKRWQSWLARHDWTDALDFMGPRVRTASWAWLLLLAGITAAAWVWPSVRQSDADLARAEGDVRRLLRAKHQQEVAAKAAAVAQATLAAGPEQGGRPGGRAASAQPGAMGEEASRHAAQLAQYLGYPWMAVIRQMEDAAQAQQAVMLSFSLDIGKLGTAEQAWPEARLSAAVHDDDAALRWAQALGHDAQLRARDSLGTPFTTPSGDYNWRAEAVWTGGRP